MSQYQDIYMRDFPGDTGVIPSTTRLAVFYSPDIIPNGPDAVPDYGTFFTNNFNGPYNYYANVQQNLFNYIYVRGMNLFPGAQTGQIFLYYADSSLLLVPANWIGNVVPNANLTNAANVSATATNQVVVGDSPFYWQPQPLPPAQGHYCLIAQVVTDQDPNPIPSGDNLPDFAVWVANHPGIAWRNVAVVTTMPTPAFSGFQGIANTTSDSALVTVTATCVNVPDGVSIALVCPVDGPLPPINTTQIVGPDNQISTNPKTNIISAVSTLPANFAAQLQLTVTTPVGTNLPPGALVTVSYYVNQDAGGPHAEIGFAPERFLLTSAAIGFPQGGVMLLLGDFIYEFDLS
jgi:hypothetical protein